MCCCFLKFHSEPFYSDCIKNHSKNKINDFIVLKSNTVIIKSYIYPSVARGDFAVYT